MTVLLLLYAASTRVEMIVTVLDRIAVLVRGQVSCHSRAWCRLLRHARRVMMMLHVAALLKLRSVQMSHVHELRHLCWHHHCGRLRMLWIVRLISGLLTLIARIVRSEHRLRWQVVLVVASTARCSH